MENQMEVNRRKFLTYVGSGMAALAVASTGLPVLAKAKADPVPGKAPRQEWFQLPEKKGVRFTPILPTDADELVLPQGYTYDVIAAYGDRINKAGDTFGFNNDFTCYIPLQGSNTHGLLWVNHEYSSEIFVHGKKENGSYMKKQIEQLLYVQGGSIIEVKQVDGKWKMITDSRYNRRITGLTPFQLTGAAKGSRAVNGATTVQGTFANCSGGITLWNTILSCEENFEYTARDAALDPTHYGWVIEVDPFDSQFAVRKHTALGRFNHENTAMGLSKDGRIVVYMGDDKTDACVYKFVSKGKYDAAKDRENSRLLEEGTLYAADMSKGAWIPITVEAVRKKAMEKKNEAMLAKFTSQADVLVHVHEAAIFLGATPTDRPEDVEIHPDDHSLYIAHTNNSKHGNIHGHITRFIETDHDLGALTFDFEIFAAGGRQSGFSAPDNLTFDGENNLWTVTDISSSKLNKGVYQSFMNNGVFVIPTSGERMGDAFQFASAPVEAELTGPWFTPDEKTLFLAVQHPGEETKDPAQPTSKWPHRPGDHIPRPAVVAIRGF